MDTGRGEERVRCIETYIAICKIDSQWEFAVCLRELKQGLCINLEGWDGERHGREVQKGAGGGVRPERGRQMLGGCKAHLFANKC